MYFVPFEGKTFCWTTAFGDRTFVDVIRRMGVGVGWGRDDGDGD